MTHPLKSFRAAALLTVAFCLALPLTGCLSGLARMEEPSVDITDVKLLNASLTGADVMLRFQVDNPNDVNLVLDGIGYRLRLNGQPLLSGQDDRRLEIAASGRTPVDLPVTINFQDLYRVIGSLRGDRNPEYALDADLRFAVPVLGDITVPVTRTGRVPVDRLLQQIGR
jgi:LEA14-like dessication related protein